MALLPKEILRPGKFYTADGVIKVTPERIKRFARNFQEMKKGRFNVPVPWEHQDDAMPVTSRKKLAMKATENAGFVNDMWVATDGSLWGEIDIPDAKDARKAARQNRYVSPQIDGSFRGVVDGNGKRWKDVITQVAITPTPIFQGQKPFGEEPPPGRVRLSMAQYGAKGRRRLSKYEDERDDDDDADKKPKGDGDGKAKKGGKNALVKEVCDLLAKQGVAMPKECRGGSSFLHDLKVALNAVVHSKQGQEDDEDDDLEDLEDEDDDGESSDGGEGKKPVKEQPVMMSRRSDRETKRLSRTVEKQAQQIADLLAERREATLERCLRQGRVSPAKAKKLARVIDRARLSRSEEGSLSEQDLAILDARLEEIQATPRGTYDPEAETPKGDRRREQPSRRKSRLSRGSGAKKPSRQPQWDGDEMTPERAKQVAEEQCRNSGLWNGKA